MDGGTDIYAKAVCRVAADRYAYTNIIAHARYNGGPDAGIDSLTEANGSSDANSDTKAHGNTKADGDSNANNYAEADVNTHPETFRCPNARSQPASADRVLCPICCRLCIEPRIVSGRERKRFMGYAAYLQSEQSAVPLQPSAGY